MKTIDVSEIESIYRQQVANGNISEEETATLFYSTGILKDRLESLQNTFPENTLHAVAIKSNSSPEVLKYIAKLGFGLEAASFEEVMLAKAAGVPNYKIVFDSPVKTKLEIAKCHSELSGIIVNANSLGELDRYPSDFSGRLGLRINPLVSADSPDLFNVSTATSKFGVPITKRAEIILACTQKSNITGLHMHIGSGIHNYKANLIAIQKIVALAHEINEARAKANISTKIEWIDIGGGIDFTEQPAFNMQDFVAQIKEQTDLFENFQVITEYGKFVHHMAGFVVSDIEYITDGATDSAPKTAFVHVGADLFLRKVYSNLPIEYPFHIIRKSNQIPTEQQLYNIAGPLCFNGDFLYYDVTIPTISTDDKFVMQNIGANTLSLWSQHCSRKEPKLTCY